MPTLSNILGNSASVTIPFSGGDSLTIGYKPEGITQETLIRLQKFTGGTEKLPEQFKEMNEVLISLLVSWDLLEDDAITVIPITVERFLTLPLVILTTVIEAIAEDMSPNSQAVQAPKP